MFAVCAAVLSASTTVTDGIQISQSREMVWRTAHAADQHQLVSATAAGNRVSVTCRIINNAAYAMSVTAFGYWVRMPVPAFCSGWRAEFNCDLPSSTISAEHANRELDSSHDRHFWRNGDHRVRQPNIETARTFQPSFRRTFKGRSICLRNRSRQVPKSTACFYFNYIAHDLTRNQSRSTAERHGSAMDR